MSEASRRAAAEECADRIHSDATYEDMVGFIDTAIARAVAEKDEVIATIQANYDRCFDTLRLASEREARAVEGEREALRSIKSLSKTKSASLWTDLERQVFEIASAALRAPAT